MGVQGPETSGNNKKSGPGERRSRYPFCVVKGFIRGKEQKLSSFLLNVLLTCENGNHWWSFV